MNHSEAGEREKTKTKMFSFITETKIEYSERYFGSSMCIFFAVQCLLCVCIFVAAQCNFSLLCEFFLVHCVFFTEQCIFVALQRQFFLMPKFFPVQCIFFSRKVLFFCSTVDIFTVQCIFFQYSVHFLQDSAYLRQYRLISYDT